MNNFSIADLKTPDYRIVVNGRDISSSISNRLISLSVTDARGLGSDLLQIELQDSTNELELPPLNAEIQVAIGWKGDSLKDMGKFLVSELEYSGAPNNLTLVATSADLRATKKHALSSTKSRSFDSITLGELVESIAQEHNLKSNISAELKNIHIRHIDQTGESDIALLTRLAENHNGMVSVKNQILLFIKIGKGISANGQRLPIAKINLSECSSFNYREITRDAYTGIIVYWNDISGARRNKVIIGTSERSKELKQTFASEEEAKRRAQSELERLDRSQHFIALTLAHARPEIVAETPIQLTGYKDQIQSIKWGVSMVTHTLNTEGFTTHIEAEPYK